jgi:hypothetical protein
VSFVGLSWYAAPQGSASGAGSEDDPWDLRSALAGRSEIEAGDILWVRGGLYRLDATLECSLAGTAERPVEVRGDPRDLRPVWDFTGLGNSAALHVTGEYVSLRRLELKSADETRTASIAGDAGNPRGRGLLVESGLGVRLIDLWVHDFGASLFESRPSGLEVYGCLFFNCYWDGPDRSHGPGLYLRNPEGAPRKRIENNCVFQHGRQGLQGFGSTPFANVDVIGNAFFNNGIADDGFHRNLMFGSAAPGHRDALIGENWAYLTPGPALGAEHNLLGGVTGSHGLRVEGNVFCHWGRPALKIDRVEGETVEGNTILGAAEFSTMDGSAAGGDAAFRERYPDNDYFNERPTGNWAALRGDERAPDDFDRTGRLLAFVLNWDLAQTVELELDGATEGSLVPEEGRQVRVSSVQDPEGYVLRYVADGQISIPLNGWSVMAPVGRDVELRPLPDTLPEFGAFLIQWDVDGEAAPREPLPLDDPGAGMPRAAARAARTAAWRISDQAEREQCKRERVRAWRAFRRLRGA